MRKKVALITGITGQDGSLLAKFLLKKNYTIHGIIRRSSSFNTGRLDGIYKDLHEKNNKLFLHYGDMLDSFSILNILKESNPDEVYNLAAQSHVKVSFELPEYTAQVDALGALRLLEGIRRLNLIKKVRYYQASTSEMFGNAKAPQSEKTEMLPASPYGIAKLYAHWITKNYRDAYNIFASTGILFNHEGPYRGETFVTQKIVTGAVNIYKKKINKIYLGNLDAKRDWGDARDFVRGMWLILQHKRPDDFVLATGNSISVREFTTKVFKKLNLNLVWEGKKENEKGLCKKTGKILIEVDKRYYRPKEVNFLLGNSNKAKKNLKWKPLITIDKMINDMINFKLSN
jgi:GDPmannose 4,6-dehydratase